jgi:chaperonin GroES
VAYSTPADPQSQVTEYQEKPRDTQLDRLLATTNIAEELDEELLTDIGEDVVRGYVKDLESKKSWDTAVDAWVKLAAQVKEPRTYPWTNAANVKYPLLSTASLQFAARAYPALVPADGKVVNMKVVGMDQQGMKADKAQRLADHMNYQLLVDMPDWEEEMDKLLVQLPIIGRSAWSPLIELLK